MKLFIFGLIVSLSVISFAQIDTVKNEKTVYFFGPSIAEQDTLNENNLDVIDDFFYYTNRIVPFLEQNNIKSEYLTDRNILIKYNVDSSITVNRDSIDFGTILTDGKNKPKILKYVLTDDVLEEKIKTYFNLK